MDPDRVRPGTDHPHPFAVRRTLAARGRDSCFDSAHRCVDTVSFVDAFGGSHRLLHRQYVATGLVAGREHRGLPDRSTDSGLDPNAAEPTRLAGLKAQIDGYVLGNCDEEPRTFRSCIPDPQLCGESMLHGHGRSVAASGDARRKPTCRTVTTAKHFDSGRFLKPKDAPCW